MGLTVSSSDLRSVYLFYCGCPSPSDEAQSISDQRQNSPLGANLRAANLYTVDHSGPNHDAAMRIGGEFRNGGPILQLGTAAML